VLQGANQLLVAGKFAEAEAEFHRAEGLAGGPCGECALGLASVRASEEKWDMTADMIQRALPLLTDPGSLARAYNQLGVAYVKGAGGGGAVSLAKAEDALRNAVDSGGPWGDIARRNLAQVLLLEEHWAEAAQVAREALAKAGSDKEAEQGARIVLCQARSHLPDELPEEQAPPRKVEGGVSRPVKIAGPMPVYTEEARKEKTEGAVIVESIIDREGCVRKVSPLQGLPHGLTEVAVQTLPLWVFSPATFDGKPVAVYYTLTINFKVDNTPPPHPM
jgi:TonB family protein